MTDFRTAKILSHQRNLQRYARLLATELTELERQYLHKRIAEERLELERLQGHQPEQTPAFVKRSPRPGVSPLAPCHLPAGQS
jgi:hypothetical protein